MSQKHSCISINWLCWAWQAKAFRVYIESGESRHTEKLVSASLWVIELSNSDKPHSSDSSNDGLVVVVSENIFALHASAFTCSSSFETSETDEGHEEEEEDLELSEEQCPWDSGRKNKVDGKDNISTYTLCQLIKLWCLFCDKIESFTSFAIYVCIFFHPSAQTPPPGLHQWRKQTDEPAATWETWNLWLNPPTPLCVEWIITFCQGVSHVAQNPPLSLTLVS